MDERGQGKGQGGHQVEVSIAGELRHESVDEFLDLAFQVGHPACCERAGDDPSQAGVRRWIPKGHHACHAVEGEGISLARLRSQRLGKGRNP